MKVVLFKPGMGKLNKVLEICKELVEQDKKVYLLSGDHLPYEVYGNLDLGDKVHNVWVHGVFSMGDIVRKMTGHSKYDYVIIDAVFVDSTDLEFLDKLATYLHKDIYVTSQMHRDYSLKDFIIKEYGGTLYE